MSGQSSQKANVPQPAKSTAAVDAWESYTPPRTPLLEDAQVALIAACQRGERQAQQRIYELFAPKMLNVCLRYVKDRDEAQDLMHDGFIRVFTHIGKFRAEAALETWITRIMINNTLSYLKKEVRKGLHLNVDNVPLQPDVPDAPPYGQEPELKAKLALELLHQLPLGYRTVFSLYVLDNYSHQDIADQLQINVGTSKSQLAKARRMLAQLIQEHLGDE